MALFNDRRGSGKNVELNNTYVGKDGKTHGWNDINKPTPVEGTEAGRIAEHNELMRRVDNSLNPKQKVDWNSW